MRSMLRFLMLIMVMAVIAPTSLQAQKEKKKKEKKEYVWKMPELTNNKDFDTYLLTCDTLNTRIREYCDNIVFYEVKKIHETDENGNVLMDENGQPKEIYAVVDSENHIRGSKEAIFQYADMILNGTNIILDMANITLLTASATTALPSLGLNAFSYGKYLKAGPKLVQYGGQEIKEILTKCRAQAKQIRAYKNSFTEAGDLIDPQADTSNLDGVNLNDVPTITKPSGELAAELEKAKQENANAKDVDTDAFDEDAFDEEVACR